jgi:hypothetical protein
MLQLDNFSEMIMFGAYFTPVLSLFLDQAVRIFYFSGTIAENQNAPNPLQKS